MADVGFSNGNKVFVALTHLFNSPLWMQDSTLSYACLEFLHTCARYSAQLLDQTTTKLIVLALCRYIQEQAQKPSRAHSKDLHNKIIVAYHCLIAWMLQWPSLLQDNEVLTFVTDVIETGLTGVRLTKSLKTMQVSCGNWPYYPIIQYDKVFFLSKFHFLFLHQFFQFFSIFQKIYLDWKKFCINFANCFQFSQFFSIFFKLEKSFKKVFGSVF